LFSHWIGKFSYAAKQALAAVFSRLHVSPNALTLASIVPMVMAAVTLAEGRLTNAAFWVLAGGFFDLMDGAVARITGRTSKFGAVLDSIVDRGTDALVYVGLALYFHGLGETTYVALSVLALGGALGVSYARARAENVIPDCRVGFAERGERLGVLVLGLLLGRPAAAVTILVAITWLTVLQRLLHVKRVLEQEPPGV